MISSSVTKEIDSSASAIPSPSRVARASVMRPSRSTSASCRSSSAMSGGWSSSAIRAGTLLSEDAIRLHDVLHDLVPNDVAGPELGHLDAVDPPQDLLHDHQSGGLSGRQVDLRDVAVHDGLGPEPEPREEHFHLLGRRV